jgi:alkylhydroperoxidase family enzyme
MVSGFGLFNNPERDLPSKLRELALTRVGFAASSQFVFSQHCKAARNAGLSEEKVAAIPAWSVTDVYTAGERAVLAYTDDLVLAGGRVQDDTYNALREELSETAVIELTYAVAMYKLHATMCRALRLEFDDVDERIVEVAAPTDGDQDVMGTISMQE